MFLLLCYLLFFTTMIQSCKSESIKLNTTNTIIIRDEINSESVSNFIYNLNLIDKKNATYVYLNTHGGSVTDGMKIVEQIQNA